MVKAVGKKSVNWVGLNRETELNVIIFACLSI